MVQRKAGQRVVQRPDLSIFLTETIAAKQTFPRSAPAYFLASDSSQHAARSTLAEIIFTGYITGYKGGGM